ncbi:hypothetical protein ACWDTP_11850, partial [Mycobacterium sp. NPDC003449]
MGRHQKAGPSRRRSPGVAAALIAPAAAFFALGGDVQPVPEKPPAKPVVADDGPPCCMEVVNAPRGQASGPVVEQAGVNMVAATQPATASRWRVINIPQLLPVGLAPERGL